VAFKIALAALLVALLAAWAPGIAAGSPGEAEQRQVTILAVQGPVLAEDLQRVPGAAVGLMNPGLGDVPPDQTWLDVSQGARVFGNKYDASLNTLSALPGRVPGWPGVLRRADSAGLEIKPGLLATTLALGGVLAAVAGPTERSDPSFLALVTRGGRLVKAPPDCPGAGCGAAVTISTASLDEAVRIAFERDPEQMVVVIESPPSESGNQLAIAIAGPGYSGMLRSPSTRTPGYVLSTDLAPTVLGYFGLRAPASMSGLKIGSGGEVDFAALAELEGRYQQVGNSKGTAMLFPLLVWFLVAGGLALVRGRLYARQSLMALCLAVVLLPAALLLTASLSPSVALESAIAGLLPVLCALALLRLLPGWDALALACVLTVAAFAIDLVAGLALTPKAVIGPNPGLGARFYGIGNELESTLMALTAIGTGAALQARGSRLSREKMAAAFLLAGLAGTVVFASGRFGADVGAAIIFPLAAVVGAAVISRRPRLIWLGGLAVVGAVALLALADTVTGGETHFVRSILEGGSSDSALDVLGHRLEATLQSFTNLSRLPVTLFALALVAFAWYRREWLRRLLSRLDPVRAGLIAAAAGSLAGALTNDSGALFIQVGVLYVGLAIAFTWGLRPTGTDT